VRAENEIGFVLVVAPTAKRDVLDGGQSSPRKGLNVMELEEGALRASVTVSGDEGALAAVTLPDRALNMSGDIPRRDNGCSKLPIRPGADRTWRPRLRPAPSFVFSRLRGWPTYVVFREATAAIPGDAGTRSAVMWCWRCRESKMAATAPASAT
jgi:hypothetical protein